MHNYVVYSPSSSSKPVWMSLFCWTQMKVFWWMWGTEQFWGTIDFNSIFLWKSMVPKNSLITNFLQNIFLCVQQKQINSYMFGTTWGWVHDDRIFIFGWTIPLIIVIQVYNTHISIDYIYYTRWDLNMYCICILHLKVMTIFIFLCGRCDLVVSEVHFNQFSV